MIFQRTICLSEGETPTWNSTYYFLIFCGLLVYSFYSLLISAYSKHTNNPFTSIPISTCLYFSLLLPIDSCSLCVFLFSFQGSCFSFDLSSLMDLRKIVYFQFVQHFFLLWGWKWYFQASYTSEWEPKIHINSGGVFSPEVYWDNITLRCTT